MGDSTRVESDRRRNPLGIPSCGGVGDGSRTCNKGRSFRLLLGEAGTRLGEAGVWNGLDAVEPVGDTGRD